MPALESRCGTYESDYTSSFDIYIYKGAGVAANNVPEGATYALVMRLLHRSNFLGDGHHLGLDL